MGNLGLTQKLENSTNKNKEFDVKYNIDHKVKYRIDLK
jgi:hypothetical protein